MAYDEIEKIFGFLNDAKTAHDNFQTFDLFADDAYPFLLEKLTSKDTSTSVAENQVVKYVESFRILSQTLDKEYNTIMTGSLTSDFPEMIKDNLEILGGVYPKFVDELTNFRSKAKALELITESEDMNLDDSKKLISRCKHHSKRVLLNADKVILNTVPILGFIHYELKRAIIVMK
jgi:hypothetical protein